MSHGIRKVLGFAAAIIVPFAAPAIAGLIGVSSTLGTALVGAGLGAAAGALSGTSPLLGAVTGGLGAYALQGGFNNLFGSTAAKGASAESAGATVSQGGIARTLASTGISTGAGTGAVAGAGGATAAGATTVGGVLRSSLQSMLTPTGIARLTLVATGLMSPTGLSAQERSLLPVRQRELKQMAATNQALFQQQWKAAQTMLAQATQFAPQNVAQLAEQGVVRRDASAANAALRKIPVANRGARTGERRRYAIAAGRDRAAAYAHGLAAGATQYANLTANAIAGLPSSAPEQYAGLMLPLYQGISDRRRQARADNMRLVGGLLGGLG